VALELELAIVNRALDAFETRRRLDLELAHVAAIARELVLEDGLEDEERVRRALARARAAIAAAASREEDVRGLQVAVGDPGEASP
jgi:hypothetical protein